MNKVHFIAILAVIFSLTLDFTPQASASVTQVPVMTEEIIFHGGGCRKSSPPGQCCHMETRTGIVHCH